MKHFLLSLMTLAFCVLNSNAQLCPNNLIVNPKFSSGLGTGWTQFSSPAAWIKMPGNGCADSFILLGAGSSMQGGIQQNINFTTSSCYDFCFCFESDQYARVRVFAATNDTSLTALKFRRNTYNTDSAQLIDSFDVHTSGFTFCKKFWTASKNYTRLIIVNTPGPANLGSELHIDNVCVTACPTSVQEQATEETISINYGNNQVFIKFNDLPFDCEITDLNGKLVRQYKGSSLVTLNNNELNNGFYLVKIVQNGKVYTGKLIL